MRLKSPLLKSPIMTAIVKQCSEESAVLFVRLELSQQTWIVSFTVSARSGIRRRSEPGGSLAVLLDEIALAKRALKLPEDANVITCYEAGRDGSVGRQAVGASLDAVRARRRSRLPRDSDTGGGRRRRSASAARNPSRAGTDSRHEDQDQAMRPRSDFLECG